ncbi:diacylglycerol/lipid kinase family protein [Neptunitalea lumnitzerae]|uniref:DAGKc domain-containing protein n=1 Tax=Neptunitalea lumnitzerae TaxID=2965509 RepID=A0ABQ5MJU7_9FLAO|nr:YegS/Rv2252/BmrU family lipid kinase [Neptunitalea sp. Y10]GLB49688.1 hypothetical protein Y10_20560 [Neptunitalea sp. Y10]
MKFFLIVNPISGDKDKTGLIANVRERLENEDSIETFETTGVNDLEQIKQKLTNKSFDRVLVAGGDGTVKLVAEAMEDCSLPIGILPAGSANGLASDLGISEKENEFIPIALYGITRTIDAVCVDGKLSLHMSDMGLNAQLIEEYEKSSIRGKVGYAINSVSTLFKNEAPYEFTIKLDDKEIKEQGIMLSFANSKKFGTGAVVNPQGKIDDGIFEVLVFKKLDIVELIKTLNNPKELSEDFVEIYPTKRVAVTTNNPVPFQVDGEFCDEVTQVTAYILPNRLEIAVPE